METRNIPARVMADVAGASVDDLRTWRTLGYLDGLGERIGAGTFFSRSEVLRVALGAALAEAGLGLRTGFALVAEPTPAVLAALSGQGDPLTFWPRGRGTQDDETRSADAGRALACAVKVIVDAVSIVRDASLRLDAALEAERFRNRRRRLSFEPAPARAQGS
jgi:hypothetical protein